MFWISEASGCTPTIAVDLEAPTTIAVIRIWNYNASRAHSYRGVRRLRILLDGVIIFQGEIRKAAGMLLGPSQCSEVLLFTLDTAILGKVEEYDQKFLPGAGGGADEEYDEPGADETMSLVVQAKASMLEHRPTTADDRRAASLAKMIAEEDEDGESQPDVNVPTAHVEEAKALETGAGSDDDNLIDDLLKEAEVNFGKSGSIKAHAGDSIPKRQATSKAARPSASKIVYSDIPVVREITLKLRSTWGDGDFVGLTGLQLLAGPEERPLRLSVRNLRANPPDLSVIGYADDPRTVDKLVNGQNVTTDDMNMWLIPFNPIGEHELTINLFEPVPVAAILVWNYNKSEEDTKRGVKLVDVLLDGHHYGSFMLRRAPGRLFRHQADSFDFRQEIALHKRAAQERRLLRQANVAASVNSGLGHGKAHGNRYISPAVRQDFETLLLPCGMLLRLDS